VFLNQRFQSFFCRGLLLGRHSVVDDNDLKVAPVAPGILNKAG